MSTRHLLPRLVVAAAFLAGAACGTGESVGSTDPPGATGPADTDESSATTADHAPFTFVAYQGEDRLGAGEATSDAIIGQGTPVILNFWAARCPPCRTEMPWFEAVYQDFGDDVLLIGLDVGPFTGLGTNEQGADLLDELDITYPAAYAVDETPMLELGVNAMPYTVFFDADGEVVGSHGGLLVEEQIRDWFVTLAGG